MSLFSFFRRDKAAQDNNRTTGRDAPSATEKQGRRGCQAASNEVDPQLPEKKRARRRLIGSVILVVSALIVLPLVFESKPQKPNLNLAIQMDSKAAAPVSQPETLSGSTSQEASSPAVDQNAQPPSDPQAAPQNNGVAAPEQVSNTVNTPAPVSEPVKELGSDRRAGKAQTDREQTDKERAEKEHKAKADQERAAREKADRERAEKERKAKADREKTVKDKAAKEKTAAKKKTSGDDPIGQMIANKTKRR